MFTELNDILDINVHDLPSKRVHLIRELTCDGSFVVYHTLCTFLKHQGKVVFLSFLQSFSHFLNVGNKLGVNLKKAREDGNLVFMEGLRRIGSDIGTASDECDLLNFRDTGLQGLKKLHSEVLKIIDSFPEGEKILLLTDDLSVLLSLGVSSGAIKIFIQYLKQMVTGGSRDICFVTLIHSDKYENDEEIEDLCTFTSHMSNMIIKIEDLASGFSHAVHGEMSVTWKDLSTGSTAREKKMQYRISDKSVNFFPLGMSSAVL